MTRIDDIRKRLEAATPGPWEMNGSGPGYILEDATSGHAIRCEVCPPEETIPIDYEFIANAPTDIAYLLRLVEEYEAAMPAWDARIAAARKRAEGE
jgi:hypothetical protein